MIDTCEVRRKSGGLPVTDEDGNVTMPSEVVYSGPCKIQTGVPQAHNPEAGEHQFTVETLQLHVPVGAGLITGDLVNITDALDPNVQGLKLRLVELARGTFKTAARWNVEAVTA